MSSPLLCKRCGFNLTGIANSSIHQALRKILPKLKALKDLPGARAPRSLNGKLEMA